MEYLQKQFPLSFAAIEKLMVEHGAKTHRDDQEWREHPSEYHLDHSTEHLCLHTEGERSIDPDSQMPQLVHVACRDLMALEIWLGGGVVPLTDDERLGLGSGFVQYKKLFGGGK